MCSVTGEKVCVEIRRDLYEKAERFIQQQGGFSSVNELVEFLLEEALEMEASAQPSREDEEVVKERLKRLGYL